MDKSPLTCHVDLQIFHFFQDLQISPDLLILCLSTFNTSNPPNNRHLFLTSNEIKHNNKDGWLTYIWYIISSWENNFSWRVSLLLGDDHMTSRCWLFKGGDADITAQSPGCLWLSPLEMLSTESWNVRI